MYQVPANRIGHEREFGEQVNAELVDLQEIPDLQYLAYQSEAALFGSKDNNRMYQKAGYTIFDRKQVAEDLIFVFLEKRLKA